MDVDDEDDEEEPSQRSPRLDDAKVHDEDMKGGRGMSRAGCHGRRGRRRGQVPTTRRQGRTGTRLRGAGEQEDWITLKARSKLDKTT